MEVVRETLCPDIQTEVDKKLTPEQMADGLIDAVEAGAHNLVIAASALRENNLNSLDLTA